MIPIVLGHPNYISKLPDFETVGKDKQKQQIVLSSVSLFDAKKGQKKTAAPMTVGNGGTIKMEKATSKDSSYQSPSVDAIETAANWYKDNRVEHQRTVIVSLRKRFDLTPLQAIHAIKRSYEIEQGGLC